MLRRASTAVLIALLAAVALAAPAQAAPRYGYLTGVVRGADGLPLRGVQVGAYASSIGTFLPPSLYASAVTDATGAYRLRLDVAGLSEDNGLFPAVAVGFVAANATGGTSATGWADSCYHVPTCPSPGRGGEAVTPEAGRTVRLDPVRLARATDIRGRVVDALGRGVGRMPVTLTNTTDCYPFDTDVIVYGRTTTDLNGNYVVSRIAPGAVNQCLGQAVYYAPDASLPNRDGYDARSVAYAVPSGRVLTKDFTVRGRGGVAGVVVDQFGNPVPGARVEVRLAPSFVETATAATTATGRFRVASVPAGAQRWCVAAEGYAGTCDDPLPTATVRSFETTNVGTVVLRRLS